MDKRREFDGEFSQFCRENDIELFSTLSETTSAFVERNIRSLKAIIFKFMHENNTDTYIDNLQQYVNVNNCRVNRTKRLAPKDVEKSDVPYLISLQTSNQFREPKNKIGRQVRSKPKKNNSLRLPHSVYRGSFHHYGNSNIEPSHIQHRRRQQSVDPRQILRI